MEKTAKKRNIEDLKRRSVNVTPSLDSLRYLYMIPNLLIESPTILGETEKAQERFDYLVDCSFELEYLIKEIRALLRTSKNENYKFTRTPEAVTNVYKIELYSDEGSSEPIRKANENNEGYEVIDVTSVSDTRYTERAYAIQIHLYALLSNRHVDEEKLKIDYNWARAIKANLDKLLAEYWV